MTSATTSQARGVGSRRREGLSLVIFAAVLVFVTGCFNLIAGIAAIASSHVFIAASPSWSLMIIAVDVVALRGLCAYGSRENLAA
jgi:hypothetical protein